MFTKILSYLKNIKDRLFNSHNLPDFCLVSHNNSQYKFIKILGSGLHGRVYLIQNIDSQKMYACKKFEKRYKHTNEYFVKKLHSEFCLTESMNNKNIIRLYELIEQNDEWYAILEYCENGDLYSYCTNKRLSVDEIEKLFKQLIDGLEYLHQKGIAHKDIKLENLLLDSECNLKISDFSNSELFKVVLGSENKLCYGLKGSPPYLAPEIYSNTFYDGEKSDIWSCGIILYIFLFNHMPFSSASMSCHSYKHFVKNKDKDNDSLISRLPKDARVLLLGMLEQDPQKRYSISDIKYNKWFATIT